MTQKPNAGKFCTSTCAFSCATLFGIASITAAAITGAYYLWYKPSNCSISKYVQQRLGANTKIAALKNSNEWVDFEVIDNVKMTHNTHLITFRLPEDSSHLGLNMASCLLTRMKSQSGEYYSKPYTPITSEEEISNSRKFSLLVKEYSKGAMSQHICHLAKGEKVEMKGPIPKINLEERSNGEITALSGVQRLAMIAGGTGITPMLQVADYILRSTPEKSSPKLLIISANDSKDDILASEQLEKLTAAYPTRIEVQHVLRYGGVDTALSGLVTSTVLRKLSVIPQETQKVFICGPPPMLTYLCGQKAKDKSQGPLDGILRDIGYTSDQVYKF